MEKGDDSLLCRKPISLPPHTPRQFAQPVSKKPASMLDPFNSFQPREHSW